MSKVFDTLSSNPTEAHTFLSWWFSGSGIDLDSVVSMVRIHPTAPKIQSFNFTLGQTLGAIDSSGLDSLIYDHQGTHHDLYFAVSTLKKVPEGKNKRGSLSNVNKVPGLWVDLDVKDGAFRDRDHVREFLNSLEVIPSAVVFTGSGGAHAYWKFDTPQSCDVVRQDALSWWAYQSSLSPVVIDKLCDPTRILRLPGSIRWPKKSSEEPAGVTTVYTGHTYSAQYLRSVSAEAYSQYTARIERKREEVQTGVLKASQALFSISSDNQWSNMIAIANMEEWFNQKYDWSGILEPMGWTCLGEDDQGRVMWSRPGDGLRKSATTDWPESPHIMSLFSSSEETGLSELHESGIILSKYRVYVELFCQGSDALAIETLRDEITRDSEYWNRL